MRPATPARIAVVLWTALVLVDTTAAQDTGMPRDQIALRYRIERMEKQDRWKVEKASKKFKKRQEPSEYSPEQRGLQRLAHTIRQHRRRRPHWRPGVHPRRAHPT